MKVFLDTGAFLALADEDDRYHTAAKSIYTELLQSRPQLLTSNFVLSETYTLIRSKVSHQATVEFMKRLDQTGLKALRVSEAIEHSLLPSLDHLICPPLLDSMETLSQI